MLSRDAARREPRRRRLSVNRRRAAHRRISVVFPVATPAPRSNAISNARRRRAVETRVVRAPREGWLGSIESTDVWQMTWISIRIDVSRAIQTLRRVATMTRVHAPARFTRRSLSTYTCFGEGRRVWEYKRKLAVYVYSKL